MVGIWSTGREEWSNGRRERGKEDEREGRGVEVERGSNSRQTPALLRNTNGWKGLCASLSLSLSALPVSPGRTDL